MKKMLCVKICRSDLWEVDGYLGAIVSLPASPEELQDALAVARIEDPAQVVVAECYGTMEAKWLAPSIFPDEPDLAELNFLAARMAELDEESLGCFHALVTQSYPGPVSMKQLINLTYNTGLFQWQPALCDQHLGEFYVEHVLSETLESLPEKTWQELRQYMDMDRIGRLRRKEEGGVFVCNGYAIPNPKAEFRVVYDGEHLPTAPAWLTAPTPALRVQLKRCDTDEEVIAPEGPEDPSAAWLSFPHTQQDVNAVLEQLGAASLDECLIFHADSTWAPGLEGLIQPESDLGLLQALAIRLAEVKEQGKLGKYNAALECTDCSDLGYAVDLCRNLGCFWMNAEFFSPAHYARLVLARAHNLTDPEFYEKVDLRDYGCALMEKHGVSPTPYGYMEYSGEPFQFEYAQRPQQRLGGLQQ